ncbi:Hypothetical Protein FCC1311_007462 [Hondaea fermentalgiana]|uniref:Uncharacterized protein n=1 Tax=Hondaea fermentalgiana TaxID=2315210 RepID=A0A2R5G0H3_9STRA|nr:Hypothetical Protein FCC1311_007462 [Hondaea fermentalgiana]|eukprot:GBG24527.1 Hypothetical Protein FCC1311_007462 [Hondaea fermentalgiana]
MSKLAASGPQPALTTSTTPRPSLSGRWSRTGPPVRPPKLPNFNEETGEETLTFVVRATPDECYKAVLDMTALMKAEQPQSAVSRTTGTADAVGSVYTQTIGSLQVKVEVRKATEGRHLVFTTSVFGEGEPKYAMQRWDFAPFHGDAALCQVTRIQDGQTLRELEATLKANAGFCAPCLGSQITSRAQDLYLDAVSRIKLHLENYGKNGLRNDAL